MNIRGEAIQFNYEGESTLFQELTFSIQSGELVALVGENGAGKTTLIKLLTGILRPNKGHIFLDEVDLNKKSVAEICHLVGYVAQDPEEQLFCDTVRKEISFFLKYRNLSESEKQKRIENALKLTGLLADQNRHPYDLIPSKRKLVIIAAVIAMDTPIVIMDEPADGQDDLGISVITQIIKQLSAEGKTILVVSHDMEFIANTIPRLLVLSMGNFLMDGKLKDLILKTDKWHQASLLTPQITELAKALNISQNCLTIPEFLPLFYHNYKLKQKKLNETK